MAAADRLSICEFTTLPASFVEDVAAYRAAGVGGIGVCELKILDEPHAAGKLRESGLAVTACVPAVPSILPLPKMPGPESVSERVETLTASIGRLAELEPACVVLLTGPGADWRDEVVQAVGELAEAAERAGVRLALEPVHPSQHDGYSFVHSLDDAVALLDEAGAATAGLLVDTWHLWDLPGRDVQLREHARRIYGVHVADRREPTRSDFDRVLPGDGVIDLRALLAVLEDAGYGGFYDVEIFSDDGTFGDHFEDSLWDVGVGDLAVRCRDSLSRVLRD